MNRRFLLIGADMIIGARGTNIISDARMVHTGQVAVLPSDDSRCDDLARSPHFVEVNDENEPIPSPAPVEVPAPKAPKPAAPPVREPEVRFAPYPAVTEAVPEDEPVQPKRRGKPVPESEVGG